ncbi:MAG: polyprenyl synthetase family protein, partial [Kiritimatiellae bacterium]|nr:polyprenyl synthetase family protein [Kiritimatiellia bacterium]
MNGLLDLVEKTLDEVLPREDVRPRELSAAMRYAVGTGGKRVRPLIALGAAIAAGGRAGDAAYPAAAIELLHNYTLVHDDLPSMDNDEMRRGKPTVWKKFGEVNAILAGDALQALAFSA